MRRGLIIYLTILCATSSWATVPVDTIPFWNIYYGRVLLIQGNINQSNLEKREIKIKQNGKHGQLIVTFNYDIGPPDDATLTIRMGEKEARVLEYKRGNEGHSRIPIMGGGSFFRIPLEEIIDLKSKSRRWQIDFYYSDKRGQHNLKLGQIVFIT